MKLIYYYYYLCQTNSNSICFLFVCDMLLGTVRSFIHTWPTDDIFYYRLSLPIAEWCWRMLALSVFSLVIVALHISLMLLSYSIVCRNSVVLMFSFIA